MAQPQGHEVPQFSNFEEAREYFIGKVIKTPQTQSMLENLRDVMIRIKASIRIDPRLELAVAVGEDAYLAGQLAIIEELLNKGHVVDSD